MKSFISFLTESLNIESFKPLDETEALHLDINDDVLSNSKILAYNVGQTIKPEGSNKEILVNPKKFPTKAIDIIFPIQELQIEVFFDTEQKKWDSNINYNNQQLKLSPDQFGQFFNSNFYNLLLQKLKKEWPLSDELYGELYNNICNKEMLVRREPIIDEAHNDHSMSNKDVTGDNIRDYSVSGRKIVKFSDMNVSTKNAQFYCWPNEKNPYRWSQWKDWKKIRPLCRMRFYHNNRLYGLGVSTYGEEKDWKNRGFRSYDLDPSLPPVQWLTKEENISIMKLNIIDKFVKHCCEKITKYISEDPEEIYKKINSPENITVQEIQKTISCIKGTMNNIIKNKQIESFNWR